MSASGHSNARHPYAAHAHRDRLRPGVVADSVPASEYEETMNKAKAMLKAVEIAERGF
jgi:hypothetical protein